MISFHIGQKVVCVDGSPSKIGGVGRVVKGEVYTIRGFDDEGDDLGLYLEEIPDEPARYPWELPDGWAAERFRPVRTTDISIFTAMLAPTPRVKEHV